jgi:hypothetical protein
MAVYQGRVSWQCTKAEYHGSVLTAEHYRIVLATEVLLSQELSRYIEMEAYLLYMLTVFMY